MHQYWKDEWLKDSYLKWHIDSFPLIFPFYAKSSCAQSDSEKA